MLGLVALLQSNVHGGIIASGQLAVSSGTLSRLPSDSNKWGGVTLDWSVARIEANDSLYGTLGTTGNFTGKYLYTYDFATNGSGSSSPDLSHFAIEVSSTFTMLNVLYSNPELSLGALGADPTSPEGVDGSASGKLFSLKWDLKQSLQDFTAILISDRDPVWGDVFLKDGTVSAMNSGYYAVDPTTAVTGTNITGYGFLATPDSTSTTPGGDPVVPEPASGLVWLVLAGFAGSPLARRRLS